MGNRAVIVTEPTATAKIGVYLHWNGGRDSVRCFLAYASMTHQRAPEQDCYGWARLCQIIGNFFGGTTSLGIGPMSEIDCNNGDNGVYIIKNWKIVGREFYGDYPEQDEYDFLEFMTEINNKMPESERVSEAELKKWVEEHKSEYQ